LKEVETDIDSMAVQTHDWYDRDFEEKNTFTGEPIATVQKRLEKQPKALLQTGSGDWYDRDFEEKNTWTGEPIATVQARYANNIFAQEKDWFDKDIEEKATYEKEHKLNQFDGLIHKIDGTVTDASGHEVDTSELVQKTNKDWCDSGIKGTDWCAQEESKDLNERAKHQKGLMFSQKTTKDWCDSGIKGTDWCAQEEAKDLNERAKHQRGLMFLQKEKQQKGWCDKGIRSENWCDEEVKAEINTKTLDDKSLYEGPTKASW